MSSKKARRKAQREKESQEARQGRFSPVTLFIVGIGLAVVVTIVGAYLLGVGSGPGEPPFPGAVWSPSHGHWH